MLNTVECSDLAVMELETTLDFINSWSKMAESRDVGGSPNSVDSQLECFELVETTATRCDASPSVNHTPQLSHTKKRKRQTPRQEIERLRLVESNLTRRLEILQMQAYNREQMYTGSSPPSTSEEIPFWKRTASQQYEERVVSERENARLKKILKLRIAQAKRVKRILHELPGHSK
ncbi:uncharacterized protein IUM83_18540 [Phytophthora cinnamomi]|uniref:uncharacterized protein n=1 Tax=Phytophthora cinnamomi TaxID=4785 RepID=UPI00355972D4|nr:hypothetical protein IUM83_18540 [Phytophthora cinnamomi]